MFIIFLKFSTFIQGASIPDSRATASEKELPASPNCFEFHQTYDHMVLCQIQAQTVVKLGLVQESE